MFSLLPCGVSPPPPLLFGSLRTREWRNPIWTNSTTYLPVAQSKFIDYRMMGDGSKCESWKEFKTSCLGNFVKNFVRKSLGQGVRLYCSLQIKYFLFIFAINSNYLFDSDFTVSVRIL